jgi:hypothetical protein
MHSRTPPTVALAPRSSSFVENTVDALEQGAHVVEKGMQTAATLHGLYTLGRGIYMGTRALAPLLAVL